MSAEQKRSNRTNVGRGGLEQRQYRRAEAIFSPSYTWAELPAVFGTGLRHS